VLRLLKIAPLCLLLSGLAGCVAAGPPVLGPLFADPGSLTATRSGRLVERPRWIDGPDNIDFALYAKFRAVQRAASGRDDADAASSWPRESVSLECVITASAQLSLCAPYDGPQAWSPERVRPYISAMHLATSMQLAPLDLDGQPVAGGRVRFSIDWPAEEPAPSRDEVVLPRMLNPPSPWEYTRLYPARAMEAGVDGDVILICIVAASGLTEGCEVFFENPSEVGYGEASQQLYRNIRVLPPTVNGRPRRAMAAATVRWRLQ
jgi:hypothetical protein